MIDTSPQVHAEKLLNAFFALQTIALGEFHGRHEPEMSSAGWTLQHHLRLVSVLGHGCHNMHRIAVGQTSFLKSPDEENLRTYFVVQCERLYRDAEKLNYPASWDRIYQLNMYWREFWDLVAAALDLPARYGVPYEKFDIPSPEETYRRAQNNVWNTGLETAYGLKVTLMGLLCGEGFWVLKPTGQEEYWSLRQRALDRKRNEAAAL